MSISTEYAAKLEVAVLCAWLMKDFAWVLLFHVLAWPAALTAISLQSHTLMLEWKTSSNGYLVHSMAALMWIVGNSFWMTSEMLWDTTTSFDPITKHSVFPWHAGPLAGANVQAMSTGVRYAQAIFISALVMLSAFYLASATGWGSASATTSMNPQDDGEASAQQSAPLVWGFLTAEVYAIIYIGPWLLKDLCWTFEAFYPALCCSAITLALMFDCLRRFGSAVSAVEIMWVFGNTIWIIAELGIKTPALAPRVVAGSFLLLGCGLTSRVYKQACQATKHEVTKGSSSSSSERTALMGNPSTS